MESIEVDHGVGKKLEDLFLCFCDPVPSSVMHPIVPHIPDLVGDFIYDWIIFIPSDYTESEASSLNDVFFLTLVCQSEFFYDAPEVEKRLGV